MTDRLLQVALMGVSGSDADTVESDTPADELGMGMGVLLRAGLRDVYRTAGYVSSPAPDPFPPAPDTTETVCPPGLETVLHQVFDRHLSLPTLTREALHALAEQEWVLSPGLLVQALSCRPKRADLLPVLGARGRWLAELNDAWQWAIPERNDLDPSEVERIWSEGTKASRVTLIRLLREIDPAGARTRLATVFASEPAGLRQDFLKALEVGLSNADESLLESALDDRSRGVREAALSLLPLLPQSAFVGRMVDRARALIVRRNLRAGVVLQHAHELPDEWRRDGIGNPQLGGLEMELGWTLRVLSSIPALVLARELDVQLTDVIQAVDQFGAAVPLIGAWLTSAAPGERAKIAPILWGAWWARPLQRFMGEAVLVQLTQSMPRDALRHWLLRTLGDPPDGTERLIVLVLNEGDVPWSEEISQAVLSLLRHWFDRSARKERNLGEWEQLIRPLSTYTAPETIGDALDLLSDIESARTVLSWTAELHEARARLRLRRSFWDAFSAARETMTTQGAMDDGNG